MFDTLLKYEDLFEASPESFGFGNVTMLRDFGPLKKDQTVPSLWFQLDSGICEVFEEDGTTLDSTFPFRLEA